jgi:HAD superfamily hydrolase (TIGR01490 family)
MKTGAFFDVDGTLLSASSGTLYTKFLINEKKIGRIEIMKAIGYYALHRIGRLDIQNLTKKVGSKFKGEKEAQMISDCDRWYKAMVRPYVRPQLIEAIENHKRQGHNIALLTAVTIYLAKPLGVDMGVDGYICNYLEVKDGVFTGRMTEPLCYGEGKVLYAKKYAAENDIDLDKSYFYTDSITDLDFLKVVGNPVIINPDPLLRREANRRKWPVHDYTHDVKSRAAG